MNKRKVSSSLLVFVLLIFMSTSSFADVYTDIEGNPHEDAILEMSRLEILAGVGNNQFAPDGELNRAAAAKVAGYLLGYSEENAAVAAQSESLFDDVEGTPHAWAKGWINLMAKDNILKGVGDNRYAPEDSLQMVHWVAILTRIFQHESEGMSWPQSYNEMASTLGLDQGLYYTGNKVMNRGEMARMTTTALYKVQRPDGKGIFDSVTFAAEPLDEWDVAEADEPVTYSHGDLSLTLDNQMVALGGGEKITITVIATYGEKKLPAAHTQIGFYANADEMNQTDQLSSAQAITDVNGMAKVTYTTLPTDDHKRLSFAANIFTDDDWLDRRIDAIVSNSGAFISGRVINPFNGEVPSDIEVGIFKNTDNNSYQSISVNKDGYFNSPVSVGTYDMNVEMNVAGTVPYPGAYKGSHFNLKDNGDIRMTLQNHTFTTGNSYSIATEMGIITGSRNLPSGSEIYITRKSDQVTQIAEIGANGKFMIALPPSTYIIYNNVGTTLKNNIVIEKGTITDVGAF